MDRSEAGKLGYKKSKARFVEYNQQQAREARARYEAGEKRCPNCGDRIPYEKRASTFCSQRCSAIFSNERRQRKWNTCPCGGRAKRRNKFCDNCIATGRHRFPLNLRFEDLKSDQSRRRRLLHECGHRCEICGQAEWEDQPMPVVLDHIDGNSDNNTRANLRLICPNCNALLPTFAGRNRGNGRWTRRQRYAKGKSS